MDTPLISILLPTYNGARYIREAIDSVLSQDFGNFELIIIDDASTDGTGKILQKYSDLDTRIIVLRNEQNLKLVATLNRGLSYARGVYIARIDDDDIWIDPSKLSCQIEAFEKNKKLAIVGTQGYIIDEDGTRTGGEIVHALTPLDVRREFGLKNALIHTSILARRSVLIEAGKYSDTWLYAEDLDLWLRVLDLGYDIMNISEYSIEYRMRSGNTTSEKYHTMQWLTFRRLLSDKNLYDSHIRRGYCLSIRLMLALLPERIIRFLK